MGRQFFIFGFVIEIMHFFRELLQFIAILPAQKTTQVHVLRRDYATLLVIIACLSVPKIIPTSAFVIEIILILLRPYYSGNFIAEP